MDNYDKEVTCISLFSGYGGLDLGVRRVIPNLRVVAYVEIEAYAVELLAQKIQRGEMDEAPIFTDVTKFPAHLFRDKVHLVIAGYPCQDFSSAGNRAGLEGKRGKMWGYTRAVVNGCNARAFFGENVDGHVSLGLDTVVSDLAEDGFMVKGGIYSAFEVGAPHLRKRIFSLSFRSDPRSAPWDQFKRGNQGWIDIDELKFRALTTGYLADPTSLGHEWSSGPIEGGAQNSTKGCGEGNGGELGDPQHNGLLAESELRGDEGTSHEWSQEEQAEAEQLKGADRPRDGKGLQRGEQRSQSTIEGCIRQTMGYPLDDGCSTSKECGETKGSEKEGGVQEPKGGSDAGVMANNESLGHGRCPQCGGDYSWRVSYEEREVGGDIRREVRRGCNCNGEVANTNSVGSLDGIHDNLGEEEGKEGEGGHKPTQAIENCSETEQCLALARIYDEGFPSSRRVNGEYRIDFKRTHPVIKWPGRPGRPQYPWEAPRTVLGDPKNTGCIKSNDEHEEEGEREGEHPMRSSSESSEDEEAESRLGGKLDAITRGLHETRIERLRMLGNGVVWLTAAKAFSELLELHQEDVREYDKLGKI